MKLFRKYILRILLIILTLVFISAAMAEVPVRISVKFILDTNGSRPNLTGGCMTLNNEVRDQVARANGILRNMISEQRVDLLEIVDATGLAQYYNTVLTEVNRDQLRNDAQNTPGSGWRNDAVNIYINNSNDSAIADFPPNNSIIVIGQACFNTALVHEMGHVLNLYHTHRSQECFLCDDGCGDTITDNSNWTIDDIATNNYGTNYANLTPTQQSQVDMVWHNVMSYHSPTTRDRLSHCQMDRESTQGYSDRSWLYSRRPTYVDSAFKICWRDGSFYCPFANLQDALNAGGLTGRVLVLQEGNYTITQTGINDDLEIVTRFGPSTVSNSSPDVSLYTLPDVENSKSSDVRTAIKAAKEADKAEREAIKEGDRAATLAATPEEKAVVRAAAEEKRKIHFNNAIGHLLDAEEYASGEEKVAIQIELAKRYRYSGDCVTAIKYYKLAAKTTEQKYLKEEVLYFANMCQEELKKSQTNP